MEQKEKELFKSLCSYYAEEFDENLLEAATPAVLGYLFFNRMQAVAYGTLCKHGLFGKVNREFRNSLKGAYLQNREKNESFFWCVANLEKLLSGCNRPYAMLKGAFLCRWYPEGLRTSNDIDLLVQPQDVTEIGNALVRGGFRQGNVRGGIFQPASRREIIEAKMTRGETVPYIKKVNLPGMEFLEVDINFSLDYKPGDTELLREMMRNRVTEENMGLRVPTLRRDDFFVHLCAHLHKEATTLPWVEMMRDMTLYKYCDIYALLDREPRVYVDFLFKRAKALGMEKVCAFAVLQTSKLFIFQNAYAVELAEEILKDDPAFIHTVVSPKEKKIYVFEEKDVENRFFAKNRGLLLREVKSE